MAMIAGHTFKESPGGRKCEYCDKLWMDIAYATKDDVGKSGWAHSGILSEHEYNQIVAERDRVFELGRGA